MRSTFPDSLPLFVEATPSTDTSFAVPLIFVNSVIILYELVLG